jgi:hypothetical protein
MTETAMLAEHGTAFMRLKPNNIVQAAEADLRLFERKQMSKAEPGELYSFARQHVRKARSVAHLVALAYFEPLVALRTDKYSTMRVYGDRALLHEALIAALQAEDADAATE